MGLGMAGFWGTCQRGVSLGCRLWEMCPYSPKALFEFHLSCKLWGAFGGHGGTKARTFEAAASIAPLASLAGNRVVSSVGVCGAAPTLGCRSLPPQAHPICLGSHSHSFHWVLSLGGGHSHTGGFHRMEWWWRVHTATAGLWAGPGSPAVGSAEATQQWKMRLSLFCLPHPHLGKCRVCTLISDDTWGRQEMKQRSN